MKFKFNSYNEDYIMIKRSNILMECYQLNAKKNKNKEEIEMIKILSDIHNICNIKNNNIYSVIIDIAVEKNSKLGQYILANQKNPQYITLEEMIHALLICINKNDWQYYNKLTYLIKTYGQANQNKKKKISISYEEIKLTIGEEIANYITTSNLYSTKIFQFDKNVYLYQNNKIIKTSLPEQRKNNPKTKVKTK